MPRPVSRPGGDRRCSGRVSASSTTWSMRRKGTVWAAGIDVVVPLVSFGPSADPGTAAPDTGALFLQQGVTRWVDGRGSARNDVRFGAVRRFALPGGGAGSDFLGVSAFVQKNREYEHARIVMGADYAGRWGRGALNLFMPTTGWRGRGDGYEERALGGVELGLRLDLTTALSMNAAVGHWQDDDGSGGWRTNGRIAAGWRPHPWLDIGVAWNGLGTRDGSQAVSPGLHDAAGGHARGAAMAGAGTCRRRFEAAGRRPVESRRGYRGHPGDAAARARASLVSQATVRFVQERAASGARIAIEVRLPAATPRALRLVASWGPARGGDPAVPGVDYVDEPIPVTIAGGRHESGGSDPASPQSRPDRAPLAGGSRWPWRAGRAGVFRRLRSGEDGRHDRPFPAGCGRSRPWRLRRWRAPGLRAVAAAGRGRWPRAAASGMR